MARSAFSKVAWVGRTASMVFGLALVMALVLGVATTAFGANGQALILGNLKNSATALTRLTGNVNGAALQVVNPNTGINDTALSLAVQAGEAPMMVSPGAAKVTNLDADKLDGKDSADFLGKTEKAADAAHADSATSADNLDGINSAGFVQGSGKVLGRRVEYAPGSGNGTVLDIPGFGTVEASCSTSGMRLGFRNGSGGTLSLFRDDGGNDPQFDTLNNGGFVYLNHDKVGNELVILQLLGPNQRLATITVTGWAPGTSVPCRFEAQGITQGA